MNESSHETPPDSDSLSTGQPAVGIRLSPEVCSDAVAGAILRARRHGHVVFVATESTTDIGEAINFAHQLGVGVIETDAIQSKGELLLDEVAQAARLQGFPGLIWQDDPTVPLDFAEITDPIQRSSAFVIDPDPKTKPEIDTPDPDSEMEVSPDGHLLPADSDAEPTLSVVIPTLDEEDGIAECIADVEGALSELDVTGEILVSDSSTDRTPEIARERGAIVVEPDEFGYGQAYRCAFERARGEYIVIGDADTTYDFGAIPRLLEPVRNGADICLGSRMAGEIERGAMPALHRYVGNPLLTSFLNTFYDAGVTDAHSGFRVLHRDALEELQLRSDGMEFASEMLMEASARGMDIEEVPIVYHEREGEEKLDSFRDGWRHVRFMLVNAPGYLFSLPGLVMVILGVGMLTFGLFDVDIGVISFGIHSMVAGSLLTIVGAQVGSFGAFATLAGDPIRRPDDPITEAITSQVRLEHGATVGFVVFGVGAVYGVGMLSRWVGSGFTRLPFLPGDIVALTAIVLGMQIVFSSFFLSMLGRCTPRC